jgi:hypothetical protein
MLAVKLVERAAALESVNPATSPLKATPFVGLTFTALDVSVPDATLATPEAVIAVGVWFVTLTVMG